MAHERVVARTEGVVYFVHERRFRDNKVHLVSLFLPLLNDSREPRDGRVDEGLDADDCLGHGGGVVGGHGGMGERYKWRKATRATLCCSKMKKKKEKNRSEERRVGQECCSQC